MRSAVRTTTAVLMGLVGFGFSANALTAQGTDLRSQRVQDLKSLVLARAADAERTERAVRDLRQEVEDVAIEYSSPQLWQVRKQISDLKAKAGLQSMAGPGVVVTLNDGPRTAEFQDFGFDPDWLLIHQQDIEAVINALWRGGAKGISVMGQRIVSTSAVRCVGSTVLVNGKVFSPPFLIVAVGDPQAMQKSLAKDKSVDFLQNMASTFGLTYEVRAEPNLLLRPYSGGLSAQYAGPLG